MESTGILDVPLFKALSQSPHKPQIVCPFCGDIYQHFDNPSVEPGGDNYQAGWWGRGDLIVIPFWGECGCRWDLCIGFHKGGSFPIIRAHKPCGIDYHVYIQSPEWKAKADAAKDKCGRRCQLCNRPEGEVVLHAHHRTYERLGHELPEDLTVLCAECHAIFHGKGIAGVAAKAADTAALMRESLGGRNGR